MKCRFFPVEDLVKEYPFGSRLPGRPVKRAVNHVSFTVEKKQTLGLVRESGSGKTTIAKCLDLLDVPSSGDIKFQGKSIFAMDRRAVKEYRA